MSDYLQRTGITKRMKQTTWQLKQVLMKQGKEWVYNMVLWSLEDIV